ncbi:MAG: hypothetical protein CW336_01885 [Bacteroidetes bacterium]|nr:hypothetical protein [Bacteroidota bacterium]
MLANLYLHADALKYNGTDSDDEFLQKFSLLMCDLNDIRNEHSDENRIKVSTALYEGSCPLYKDQNIYEVTKSLGKEEFGFICWLMGNTSDAVDLSLDELQPMTAYQKDESECNALVFLNKPVESKSSYPIKYMDFDQYEIVYGKASWITLRRQIMGNHPGSPKEFMKECELYFPNILFHSNCTSSITDYLSCVPRKIVYYLSCMNDKFLEHLKNSTTTDENVLLADFCGKYGFDDNGTRQSTPGKKSSYQFKFLKCGCADLPENYKKITCDPHMKIKWCDDNKKTPNNFTARIYFHYGDDEVAPEKILVGSIGPHI